MRNPLRFLFLLGLLFIWVVPVHTAELGVTVFKGKKIILDDDGTWQYENRDSQNQSTNCTTLSSDVVPYSICLSEDNWTFADLGGESEITLKHKDHELYMLTITERIVHEMPVLKKAAISNAQAASGLTKVNVLEDKPVTIDDHDFGKLVYRTKVDGIDITYANFYSNFEDIGSIQLIFFAGSGQFDDLRSSIDHAVSKITVEN